MRTVKGTVLCTVGIALGIIAVGVGDAISNAQNGWIMLAYTFLALGLLSVAILLCAFGVNAENERADQKRSKKLSRVPHHTSEWRDAQ